MNSTSTIHVIETIPPQENEEVKKPPPTDEELQQFMLAFGLAVRNPAFMKIMQRLGRRENLENIAATCPELTRDSIGMRRHFEINIPLPK